ncbi:MAG: hypothetical protein H6Q42_3114 [Deltaproteobacteria bacterium]|nr:hypothetical protein [Deltaproteobacteria bacterium]
MKNRKVQALCPLFFLARVQDLKPSRRWLSLPPLTFRIYF